MFEYRKMFNYLKRKKNKRHRDEENGTAGPEGRVENDGGENPQNGASLDFIPSCSFVPTLPIWYYKYYIIQTLLKRHNPDDPLTDR